MKKNISKCLFIFFSIFLLLHISACWKEGNPTPIKGSSSTSTGISEKKPVVLDSAWVPVIPTLTHKIGPLNQPISIIEPTISQSWSISEENLKNIKQEIPWVYTENKDFWVSLNNPEKLKNIESSTNVNTSQKDTSSEENIVTTTSSQVSNTIEKPPVVVEENPIIVESSPIVEFKDDPEITPSVQTEIKEQKKIIVVTEKEEGIVKQKEEKTIVQKITETVKEVVNTVVETIKEVVNTVIETVKETSNNIVESIVGTGSTDSPSNWQWSGNIDITPENSTWSQTNQEPGESVLTTESGASTTWSILPPNTPIIPPVFEDPLENPIWDETVFEEVKEKDTTAWIAQFSQGNFSGLVKFPITELSTSKWTPVIVYQFLPNDWVSSPFVLVGKIKNNFVSEWLFSVQILNQNKDKLKDWYATTFFSNDEGDTENGILYFLVELVFDEWAFGNISNGYMRFIEDNTSIPIEERDFIDIPITF